MEDGLSALLKEYWGQDAAFLSGQFYIEPEKSAKTAPISQETILRDILTQSEHALSGEVFRDVVLTAPTGSGKSLFFQLAGLCLYKQRGAVTLVISPLVALMHDQVAELCARGVSCATFLDSTLTYQERVARIEGVKQGEYGLVYLSPELLLSLSIWDLIGQCPLGLVAVDEAHLVTSWGRDFRVDYWFLGDYFTALRGGAGARRFPVVCLTATAVNGGREDVVGELATSLSLRDPVLYLGYARRDNIDFDIRTLETGDKTQLTLAYIQQAAQHNEKTLCYFPFVTQSEEIAHSLSGFDPALPKKVALYNSRLENAHKESSYATFKSGETPVMLATKAFGMGVNIPDVKNVYHYAPTGSLSDYVQEIGRAARALPQGCAVCDALPGDMRFARTLWGMSGLRHYQLREMAGKLIALRRLAGTDEFTVSPDSFTYLFGQMECENKVKSGLMLLSGDMEARLGEGAMTVHLDGQGGAQYIVVPTPVEDAFLKNYGACVTRVTDDRPRVTTDNAGRGETVTRKAGGVYRVDPMHLWETSFQNLSYPQCRKQLMASELFQMGQERVAANVRLSIDYREGFQATTERLGALSHALQQTFSALRRKYGGKEFALSEFLTLFEESYGQKSRREMGRLLLDVFSFDRGDLYDFPQEQWKFVEKKRGQHEDTAYAIRTERFGMIEAGLKRYLSQAAPNTDADDRFVSYLPIPKPGGKVSEYQLVAQLLELLHLATYDMRGGRCAPLRVSIQDPDAVEALLQEGDYRNTLLTAIEKRHERAETLMTAFMRAQLSTVERWDVIEQYFLGQDDQVDAMVGIKE